MSPTAFLGLLLLGALLVPGRSVAMLLYFVAGLFLMARLSLEHALRRVAVAHELSDRRIFAGETLTVRLRFTNPTPVPIPWLQYVESRPTSLTAAPFSGLTPLAAGQSVEASYDLHGAKRGRYQVGPLKCWAGDPFGFLQLSTETTETATFTVYPRPLPLPDLGLPARLPMGDLATRRRLFEDPSWLAGTRPYAPGDPLRRVHWNATARTGELMVRQFRHQMLLPCCVAVDLVRSDYDPKDVWHESELAVTAAASLVAHAVGQKQQVALLAAGLDPDQEAVGDREAEAPVRLPLRQGQAAVAAVLEALARIQLSHTQSFAALVAEESRRMPWGTLFLLVAPRQTAELDQVAGAIAGRGQQVLLFLTAESAPIQPAASYRVLRLSSARGEVAVQ